MAHTRVGAVRCERVAARLFVVLALVSQLLSACGGMIVFDTKRRPGNIFDEALEDHDDAAADQAVQRRILSQFPPGSDVDDLVRYLSAMESRCQEEVPGSRDIVVCENSSWSETWVVSIILFIPFESNRRRSNHRYYVKIFSTAGKTQNVYVRRDSPDE